MKQFLNQIWYQPTLFAQCLRPLSWIYRVIIALRRCCYHLKIFASTKFPVPVVIVGNITVGGTGKTPLVRWLVEWLQSQGYRPGIVSRGYKGTSKHWPQIISSELSPTTVGDEAYMLFLQTGCPVVVAPDRVAAVKVLLDTFQCDIVVSDDGLQHYALARDIEIAVIDSARGLGNQLCLPAGPLREPCSRLHEVDIAVFHGGSDAEPNMKLTGSEFHAVGNPDQKIDLETFQQKTIHAVAGIGHPQRFFDELIRQGLTIKPHIFPDHHRYQFSDINFAQDEMVIMTEKDAVKCRLFADDRHWYFPVRAQVNEIFELKLKELLLPKIKPASGE